ncbi:MAG: ATP-binding protein, partial [Planctomycetes bacterium]|nr:ATP-binding protein [Planctomycetota bacterium]
AVTGEAGIDADGEATEPREDDDTVLVASEATGDETTAATESGHDAAAYLAEELALAAPPAFVRSAEAAALADAFAAWLAQGGRERALGDGLDALAGQAEARHALALAWVAAWAGRERPELAAAAPEVAAALVAPGLARTTVSARTVLTVDGLLGSHARLRDGRIELRLDEVSARLGAWERARVPEFRAWQRAKQELVRAEEERLRLSELRPEVLTSFVRNRLVDEVFLPLIGDNLAKQIGAAGGGGRTDRQGMLLLLSPPGYGKTTLMEWLAATLGLALVKVNGPAIGHAVTSLDPAEAGNAAARREVERINLALAMGDNVMLYLDDIQHLGSELLQKFIPLCDGTRRIEGVWEGRPRTADLRGKRFAVVMAGNPYTETGERFRLPDMLANRADVYNLGDIIGGARAQFELSYLENCLVANPVLAPLAGRPPADFHRLLRLAEGDEGARAELEHPYTATEVGEITAVLRHLRIIQGMLLLVNQAYIASSQQAEGDRTEPPCKVQGSYRTMGKLAAKVVPAMNPDEVRQLVVDLYRQESQTLTSGAEASFLKAKGLFGLLTAEESARWEELCRGFRRRQELMGGKDDPASLAVVQLAKLAEGLERLRGHLALPRPDPVPEALAGLAAAVERAGTALAAARAEPAPTVIEPKVEIINTLPAYYAKLYEHHLKVVETSLVPVLELLGRFTGTQAQTRGELRAVLARNRQAGRIELDRREAQDGP